MDTQGTSATLVRKVRTFADDVRRAKAGSSVTPPTSHEPTSVAIRMQPVQTSRSADEKKPLNIRQEAGGRISQEGTVITDTRRKRWSLGKALGQSFTAWVDEQKNAIAQTDLGPNVPPVSTRATVLQAARERSAIAPQDDHIVVVEKLRTFARDAERATGKPYTFIHKPLPAETAPSWSYTDENNAEERAGGAEEGRPSPIKQARQTIRPPQAPSPIHIGNTAAQPVKSLEKDVASMATQSLPEQVFVQTRNTDMRRSRRAIPLPYGVADVAVEVHTRHAEESVPAIPQPETLSRDIVFKQPTFATVKTENFRTYRGDAIHDVEQNKRSIPNIIAAEALRRTARTPLATRETSSATSVRPFVIAGAIIVCSIALSGFGFFWYIKQHPGSNTTTVSIPTFIAIDAQKSVPFLTNRAQLLETLATKVAASGTGVTQLYPIYGESQNEGTFGATVPTSNFMRILDPRAAGSFIRNLDEEMMFGAYNATDPFFILKTKQFDTAFAGMLDWEQYISADLTPLFGTPVERTYDATLRTIDQTRGAYFVDDTVRNVDVRVLYDETGKERILYAFLNKNTLVITTSSAALSELIGRLQ